MRKALAQAIGSDETSIAVSPTTTASPADRRTHHAAREPGTDLGVNLQTDAERATWHRLQDHWAMMDSIAVRNFLAASL